MTEEEKFYVHKYSGHYYTENRIPASGKVLFEGTEKECYEFVKKEMEILPYEERDFCNGCFPIVCREVYNKANDGMTVKEIRERVRKIIGDNKE